MKSYPVRPPCAWLAAATSVVGIPRIHAPPYGPLASESPDGLSQVRFCAKESHLAVSAVLDAAGESSQFEDKQSQLVQMTMEMHAR